MFGEGTRPKISLNILKLYLGKFHDPKVIFWEISRFYQKVHNSVIFMYAPLP